MGMYDTIAGVQLKAGTCVGATRGVGESVVDLDLEDGVYLGYGGVVVIIGGEVTAMFDHAFDKWGGIVSPDSVIDGVNPIAQAIKEIRE